MDNQQILKELKTLVGDELRCISYKWLARKFNVPVNLAKQLLFAFAEEHRSKVSTSYLLAGWTKKDKKHNFQIVDAKKLQDAKQLLDPITALHVYSVQPSQPKDPSELWNADRLQLAELYDSMLRQMQVNCLAENTVSAIHCPAARRNHEARPRVPAPPIAAKEVAAKPGGLAARLDGVIAGATGSKKGVASTSVAVEDGSSSAKAKELASHGPASAPAALKRGGSAQTGGSKSAMAGMWKNAPPKKPKAAGKAAGGKQARGAADAEEALRIAEEASSSEDDLKAPAGRTAAKRSYQAEPDSDDDAVRPGRPAQPQGGGRSHAGGRKRASLVEDSDDEGAPPSRPSQPQGGARGRAGGKKRASLVEDSGDEASDGAGGEAKDRGIPKPKRAKREAAAKDAGVDDTPAPGKVKDGGRAGPQRRKVVRTVINDSGEEITETVFEDEDGGDGARGSAAAAGGTRQDAPPPDAKESGKPTASAKLEARKPAPAKKASPPKAAAKKGAAKGKAASAGQKSLTSFFKKK